MTEFDATAQIDLDDANLAPIKQQIAERLAARRARAVAQGLAYDHLTDTPTRLPGTHADAHDLHARLRGMDMLARTIQVSPAMRDRQLPIFNALFFRSEMLLHKLVVKYVNRLAGRQVLFDLETTEMLASLLARVEQLHSQVQMLEHRLDELNSRGADKDTAS